VKFEGDGVMFVSRVYAVSPGAVKETMRRNIRALLDIIDDAENTVVAQKHSIRVGAGCVVGKVIRMGMRGGGVDYVGHRVNLAARLCDRARPGGLVVAADPRVSADPGLQLSLLETLSATNGFMKTEVQGLKGIGGGPIQAYSTVDI
jgi:class 3 adenylate cyclase